MTSTTTSLPFDLPSAAEVLTIERYGFPRIHNLNDGMGGELGFQDPAAYLRTA